MSYVTVYLDDATEARLRQAAKDLDRKIEDLCTAAVSEAALDFFRFQTSRDPAKAVAARESA